MTETCTNCGNDVDKEPTVLCDECDGSDDLRRRRLEAKIAEVTADNRRLVALNAGLTHSHTALADSQAQELELRKRLFSTCLRFPEEENLPCWCPDPMFANKRLPPKHTDVCDRARAALARKPSTEALRAMMVKTATNYACTRTVLTAEQVADAVLRGES